MGLISNQLDSLHGGVNQQSVEQRLPTQVSEMINAYPTLDVGLRMRNPSTKLNLSHPISYKPKMWVYEYDRGLAGTSSEKYSVTITADGMNIINVLTGEVFNKRNGGIVFPEDSPFSRSTSERYLTPFIDGGNFAAVTIKDTTFITNKSIEPKMSTFTNYVGASDGKLTSETFMEKTIWFNKNTAGKDDRYGHKQSDYCPCSCVLQNTHSIRGSKYETEFTNSQTTINVDGAISVVKTPYIESRLGTIYPPNTDVLSYDEYIVNVKNMVVSSLNSTIYEVSVVSDLYRKGIRIKKLDTTPIHTLTLSIAIGAKRPDTTFVTRSYQWQGKFSDYYNSTQTSTRVETSGTPPASYNSDGFIWLQGANPAHPYLYTYTITSASGNEYEGNVENTTTEKACEDIAKDINANSGYLYAEAIGSVIRITTLDGSDLSTISVGDSFGNQASFAWTKDVSYSTELPKNMPFENTLVKVVGVGANAFQYWLQFKNGQWRESLGYKTKPYLDTRTMPQILVREANGKFTFKKYDGWKSMLVGDGESNEPPSFTQNANTIKDICFFKNRLGFITNRTVVFSAVGDYGNFFRTTVVTLLDSDPIDTTVDSSKGVRLEYITFLADSLLLFSHKAQFKLEGGKILSPKDIQISKTSAYEINTAIRPLYMNNKIFFCSVRGGYSAIMQYQISPNDDVNEAIDITAHVQSYIPNSVTSLTGNGVNNMLFITTSINDGAVWVYKYYDDGGTRVQSAWFKWVFSGNVYNAFSLGENLNLLINRNRASITANWVLGSGVWDNSKLWDNSQLWAMSPKSLSGVDQFEIVPLVPQPIDSVFLDDGSTVGNETFIPVTIDIGEWVLGSGSNGRKDIRGHLQFKTIKVSSDRDSAFDIIVKDVARSTARIIPSKYVIGRKPMVYGNAKNIRISISNSGIIGFRINAVSYEGNLNKRDSRR